MTKKRSSLLLMMLVLWSLTAPVKVFAEDDKQHWFFPNHPRLRRIFKAAGLGAATGGLAAPLLGASVGGGMLLGAGEHATLRGVKDKHDMKKKHQLDHHIW